MVCIAQTLFGYVTFLLGMNHTFKTLVLLGILFTERKNKQKIHKHKVFLSCYSYLKLKCYFELRSLKQLL